MPKLSEIARELGLKVAGELNPVVKRVSSIGRATPDALVFAGDEEGVRAALASKAGAVIVPVSFAGDGAKALLPAAHPKLEFARAARLLRVKQLHSGVHETAVLGEGTGIAEDVFIGATSVIGAEVGIGAGSHIDAGCVIGDGVRIGSGCRLYPRVTVYPGTVIGDRVIVHAGAVLGADGFGYVRDAATGKYIQFPQQGGLVIEDDVEIGANSTVDKGALEETRIGRGTKIDNLVHIGHNCHVGQDVVIAAQAGLSGSITVEDGAVLGGQVGIGEHATVGAGVIVGGQGGILPGKKLKGKGVVFWGTPAKPVREYLKELATLARLTKKSS